MTLLEQLRGKRVLITGARGSLGTRLLKSLDGRWFVHATDIGSMDVRNLAQVAEVVDKAQPDVVFHLAGAKHAPEGELDPFGVARTNIEGTDNVLMAARAVGAKVVLASSCKACNPETAYGATKLIAERMVLNAGGTVARFYNVVETCGNVFETWRNLPDTDPVPVTPCSRYFISIQQAVELLLWCAALPTGRYCVDPGEPRLMQDVAAELYPSRTQLRIPPRRGDRIQEPRYAEGEVAVPLEFAGVESVWSPHDPVRQPMREEVAA
jgi:FlaA1/EpsC-like NDP-sugar epimerase